MPGLVAGVLALVQEDFAEEARIEGVVGLALGFKVGARGVGAVVRGLQDAVEAESGLLDFLGTEPVASRLRHVQAGEFEERGRVGLERAIEQAVGFHGIPVLVPVC